jgi:glycosyltransferase involved in cell wall biosynthesis
MTEKQLITFVLPVFNEELNVEELTKKINATMQPLGLDYELLFVDDGSSDGSFKLLTRMQQADPRIRAIRFRRNFGKAAAYAAGFDHANGDIIITMDTDLQDDPAEIPLFLEQLKAGYDMVSGWKHTGKGPLTKSLPSRFFNAVVRRVTGIPLHDFNCPFKAYRKEVLEEIDVYGELHRYIPVLAFARGFNVTEIKISNLPRIHGSSNYGFERFIRGMFDLITVVFITRFAKRPMHLLAMAGVLLIIVGIQFFSRGS